MLMFAAALAVGAGDAAAADDGVPYYVIPPGPTPGASGAATAPALSPKRLPTLAPSLPGPNPSEWGRGPAPTYRPPATAPGQFAPAPNTGPVTGYGIGGMETPPGAGVTPPYTGAPYVPGR